MAKPDASEQSVPHVPVLMAEVLEALAPLPGSHIVDGTFGAGGYSRALLEAGASVTAIDRDPNVKPFADALSARFPSRFNFVAGAFAELDQLVSAPVDGVVLDIGVSSMQLDEADRGFSFMRDGPLGAAAGHYAGAGVRGCDHGFVSVAVADGDALSCLPGPGGAAALAVQYEADAASTWPGAAGQPTDCAGNQIAASTAATGGSYVLAHNRFFIRVNPQTGQSMLYCAGSGGTGFAAQPLIDNVEHLQLRWGIGDEGRRGVPDGPVEDRSDSLVHVRHHVAILLRWPGAVSRGDTHAL